MICPKSVTLKNWSPLDFLERWNMMIFLSQTKELIVGIYLDWFIAQSPSAQREPFFSQFSSQHYCNL